MKNFEKYHRSRNLQIDKQYNVQRENNAKWQMMVDKTLDREINIEQQEPN